MYDRPSIDTVLCIVHADGKIGVGSNALCGLHVCPKPIQKKVYELGLTDLAADTEEAWHTDAHLDRRRGHVPWPVIIDLREF